MLFHLNQSITRFAFPAGGPLETQLGSVLIAVEAEEGSLLVDVMEGARFRGGGDMTAP